MGLDMYLSAEKYISAYDWKQQEEKDTFRAVIDVVKMPYETPSVTISTNIAYWRKANAIHNWFVNEVQDGVDECQRSSVSREQLQELVDLCKELLLNKDPKEVLKKLPPTTGFFFGTTDIGDYFWQDIEHTIHQIEPILANPALANCEFHYQSSW
jgi:hypothetical protein